MGRKGLSKEEKLSCILNVYHTKLQPFNLKEIEKEGSALGVVQQSIKDVNKELCDDGLVSTDKIGSGVFFWAFPSATFHSLKQEEGAVEAKIRKRKAAIAQIERNIEEARETRKCTGREVKIRRLYELQEKEKRSQPCWRRTSRMIQSKWSMCEGKPKRIWTTQTVG